MTDKAARKHQPVGNDTQITDSTGNVFEDMRSRDADERLAKAKLARLVRRELEQRGLSQKAAAGLLGIQQPDVSDLVRGKLSRFSISRLERFLNALDLEIRIVVGPRPEGKAHAGITVESVEAF